MWKSIKRYSVAIGVAASILAWSAIFYFIPVDTVVNKVGIDHTYLISFAVSLIAGFSSLTGTTAYATVVQFSRAGANPLILGLASGVGLFLSDSAFYLLVMRGRESLEGRFKNFFKKVESITSRLPVPVFLVLAYVFCALGPIPNDILSAFLIVAGYRYRHFWPILLAGDVTFMLLLSYLFISV